MNFKLSKSIKRTESVTKCDVQRGEEWGERGGFGIYERAQYPVVFGFTTQNPSVHPSIHAFVHINAYYDRPDGQKLIASYDDKQRRRSDVTHYKNTVTIRLIMIYNIKKKRLKHKLKTFLNRFLV